MSDPTRLLLPALRLDREPFGDVRRRALAALERGVGGFVLFGGEADRVATLTEALREAAGRPLWFAADLERGAGQQFAGLPVLPPPAGLAAHPEPQAVAHAAGRRTGRDARAVGVNLVLAPVLDLDLRPDNPIVGTRSFGADPAVVSELGAAWIEACQAEGVLACAKHFPGHGRTAADSHLVLPRVEAGAAALEADLAPFRRAAPRVGAVMTAHVAYPALGAAGPATLSRRLLGDVLRGELGFEGLVVTDALDMAGVRQGVEREGSGAVGGAAGGAGDRADVAGRAPRAAAGDPAVAALAAGCDLLLYPPDLAVAAGVLARAAEEHPDVAERVRQATARGAAALARVEAGAAPGDGGPEAGTPFDPGAAAEADALLEACVQVRGVPPGWARPGAPLAVRTVWDDRPVPGRVRFGLPFAEELAGRGWRVEPPMEPPQAGASDRSGDPDVAGVILLIAASPQAWKGTTGLRPEAAAEVRRWRASGLPTWPVVFGHLRLLDGLGGGGLCAWSPEPEAERAAARRLAAAGAP